MWTSTSGKSQHGMKNVSGAHAQAQAQSHLVCKLYSVQYSVQCTRTQQNEMISYWIEYTRTRIHFVRHSMNHEIERCL